MPKRFKTRFLWVLMVLWPISGGAQTDPRAVLDKAIEALGGEAYLGVQDMRVAGRFFQFQRGQLVSGELFTDYVKLPDKERTEFGEDEKVVRINNGVQGWNVNDGKVEEQIPEQIDVFWEEFKVSLDYLLRYAVNDSQTTLQYLGREMVDFKRADVLELRDDDRTRIRLYIDRETGLLLKKSVRRLDDPAVQEEVYSNFHEFDGVLTPLLVVRSADGLKTMEIRLREVSYNNSFPDTIFLAPVGR